MFTKPLTSNKPTALLFILIVIILFGCRKKTDLLFAEDEFGQYINAYTSGIISKKSAFRIQLAADAPNKHSVNETIKEPLFSFSPSVKGNAYWVDDRTIEFKPAKDLMPNESYTAEFNLGKVIDVPSEFKIFSFKAEVIKPSFQVEENGLQAVDETTMTFRGKVVTADVEDSKTTEKLVTASCDGKNVAISWQHNEENREHNFFVEGIKRKQTAGKLLLKWSGDALNAPINDQREIEIPAIGDFKVMEVRAVQADNPHALVQFSEPLLAQQQFEGLVEWSGMDNLSYSVNGSELKIFTGTPLDKKYTLIIHEGIENLWHGKLNKRFTAEIVFENPFPSVKIHGEGVILPSAGGKLVLPFEAANLKAVDISIIKIYENNIASFLHSSTISNQYNLRQFARPFLARAMIKLEGENLDLRKKNKFFLDLGKYIKAEPGAIYRTIISFRKDYSLYACTGNIASKNNSEESEDDSEESEDEEYYNGGNGNDDDGEFWDFYNSNLKGYKWSQRNNPCHKSYYRKENFAVRNILATNIGLTAKAGLKNKLLAAVTHLVTAEPLGDAELQAFDFQNQLVGSGKSDASGIVEITLVRKPYLLIAKKGNERSYLKIDDGSSLPLSQFDVGGVEAKNGIKGFIFGERGVWRPGDSLFIACLIQDKNHALPAEHPVKMELFSPKGQLYKSLTALNNSDGFNVFRTVTDADAPTGNWLCRVKLGGSVFEKTLKIETIMPNRLKIDLNFGEAKALGKGAKINGKLSAKWLFGATAQNLKAKVDVQLYRRTATFNKFKDFVFENPAAAFSPLSETIFDGTLDSDGTASVNPAFEVHGDAPGMLSANLDIKVFEPGGNFSVDNVSMPYHPYASYVGVKVPQSETTWGYQYIAVNKNQTFQLAHVNTDGTPMEGNTAAEVSLYRIRWNWWRDNTGDDISNYAKSEYSTLVKTENVALKNGRGSFAVKLDNYGRYLILAHDKKSGHKAGQIFYADNDSWRSRVSDATASTMLTITSAKEKYAVGETVEVSIPSSKQGKALISLESGSKVVKLYWTETQNGVTKFSFKAEKEMTPGIYVNVSLIQPHEQTINDLPIRMYGILPVAIEDKEAILHPVIAMNDVIRPEEPASITVSEKNKKPFTYVIAIVDEGLLDLTHFKTPNPYDAFFAKEALGVKSWDLYDYVIGAWGGELERILTIGGDEGKADAGKGTKANRFKPVVKFLGPFKSSGESSVHRFTLPSYMGSVKAMVIAAGDNAYGFAEKAVAVKKPLMLLSALPRVLGPGEEITVPVTVFATENNIKNVQVSIQSNPLIETSGSSKISFARAGEQTVFLKAKVKNKTGIGKIKVMASSGEVTSFSETELDVRNPNPFVTKTTEAVLQGGQTFADNISKAGDDASSKATIEISSIPAINLQKRLSYLIQYPHGCIEQTTSAAFPQLVLNEIIELDDYRKAEVEKNVRFAIRRLQNFQTRDGGFGYWPGDAESDEWGTNYAGNFLLEAMSRGYNIPSTMVQQWKNYMRKKALEWNMTGDPEYGSDLTQAYRLYLLALAKSPEIGAMNRLKENKFITPEAKWRLAAAYHLVGQAPTAIELINKLPVKFAVRTSWGVSYGSDLRDEAMVLETLAIMKKTSEAEELMRTIAAELSQEDWYSTQTTAYSLIAIARYSNNFSNDKKINALIVNQGNTITVKTKNSVSQTAAVWKNGKSAISIKNNGNNVLYVRIINQGQPIGGESIQVANNPAILLVNADYLDAKGNAIDIGNLKQGTDFAAKITVKNPGRRGNYTEMALTQIFPGGWEIINTRLYNSEGSFKSSESSYMDIRDDRVYHYFNIKSEETLTYYVRLNAAYLGKYYFPGVYCEAMYDRVISGGSNGRWVEITEKQKDI